MNKRFLHLDFKGIVPAFEALDEYFRTVSQEKTKFDALACRVAFRMESDT